MMQGKLIVMEGIDGSGKSTQYQRLCQRLSEEGRAYRKAVFPRYDQDSSALIRSYLGGQFGDKPEDVNAYAASTFFAVDRFAAYKTDWGAYYDRGGLVLADRYTTSNACHQGSKLDIDVDTARRQMARRQADTHTQADIHERDFDYLARCLEMGHYAAAHYGWTRIPCTRDGELRGVEEIHQEIYDVVCGVLTK